MSLKLVCALITLLSCTAIVHSAYRLQIQDYWCAAALLMADKQSSFVGITHFGVYILRDYKLVIDTHFRVIGSIMS